MTPEQPEQAQQPPVEGPPWLAEILNDAGAAWVLLRHAPDAPADGQDLDVLIDPAGHADVAAGLHARGFATLRTPGRGRTRFFLRYDPATGSWPKLDVVTRLAFGPHKELRTSLARGVLERRQRWEGGLRTPSAVDAFWVLLLHAMLDKRQVMPHHQERLTRLVGAATATRDLWIPRSVGLEDALAHALLSHVQGASWEAVEHSGRDLLVTLRRRQHIAAWSRRHGRRALRRAARHGLLPGRGLSVAVITTDEQLRRAVVEAIAAIPVPAAVQQDRRLGPVGGIAIGFAPPADLVIRIIPSPPAVAAESSSSELVLDAALPLATLKANVVEAVWHRYVGRAADPRPTATR